MENLKLIINADDFGYSQNINKAIIKTFEKNLCSSATIMANMPGFEEAVELIKNNKVEDKIGIHLVLTEGKPLTNAIKKHKIFCDEMGNFNYSRNKTILLSQDEKIVLAKEIESQIDRCRKFGLPLTHLDSHHHVHTELNIFNVVKKILIAKKIKYIRLSRNCGNNISGLKRVYKFFFNEYINFLGLKKTAYFGSIEDFIFMQKKLSLKKKISVFEIMVHPILNSKNEILDSFNNNNLENVIGNILQPYNLCSY
jgi:predicted glycoside hydrolase/deacetylase ChbG (UPF0249 family)